MSDVNIAPLTMWEMMPLLSVYWPHLITVILVYSMYVLIFGQTRSNGINYSENALKNRREPTTQTKEGRVSTRAIDEDDEEDDVTPATFPEDTPHIPYLFNEMSEVKLIYWPYYNYLYVKMNQQGKSKW